VDAGLLDQLDADDRRVLLAGMTRRRYRRGDTLFHEGDPGDTLHVIDKGHVAIRTTTSLGDVATLTVLGPPAMFGEQALVGDQGRRTASAVALDQVETRALRRSDFDALLGSHPRIERFVVEVLAAQVRRLTSQLIEALYVPADRRVVHRLAEVAALYDDGTPSIEIPIKQDDIASMAGTTRPTANRILKQLEAAGVIELSRGRILVVDRHALDRSSASGR
jgi:CRP/FNR family transcriptional regulator, cyclic AMP receptor protein